MAIAKGWIFSKNIDLVVFLGPTVLGLFLYLAFRKLEIVSDPTPSWALFLFLTASDSVHVFSTSLRTYLDKDEFIQRKLLYVVVPIICYSAGVLIYLQSSKLFWIALTYLNVIHIVRQQYGWMAYSNRKANGDRLSFDWKLDRIAIYNVTLFPLIWWHAHLPRPYKLQEEFIYGIPQVVSDFASVIFWIINVLYLLRQSQLLLTGKPWNPAKFIIWGTTLVTWYSAMILANSEFEFLTLGSLIHAVPYLALIFFYKNRNTFQKARLLIMYLGLLIIAVVHDQFWDWSKTLSPLGLGLITPLITLPFSIHYVLDAFIWKVGSKNPLLVKKLEFI